MLRTFQSNVGCGVTIKSGNGLRGLDIITVTPFEEQKQCSGFSVIFKEKGKMQPLSGTYEINLPHGGPLVTFLQPIGPYDGEDTFYEAVFNHVKMDSI